MPPRRDELPVVAQAYRLAGDVTTAVQNMPRGLRAVLGSELLREAVGLCADLQQAALHRQRTEILQRSDVHITRVRVLVRLAFDQRALSTGMYEAMHVGPVTRRSRSSMPENTPRRFGSSRLPTT